jgi:hypothetical protein
MVNFHDSVLVAPSSALEEKASSAWFMAEYCMRGVSGPKDPKRSRGFCREAALLGHSRAQVNYLYSCLRDKVAVDLDAHIQVKWLAASLTSDYVFKPIDSFAGDATVKSKLRNGFETFFGTVEAKDCLDIMWEIFIQDVVGGSYAPSDKIVVDGKWDTIASAREKSFEEFRKSFGPMAQEISPDTLHEAAVFGNADVVRELIQTYNMDIDFSAQDGDKYIGQTPLQAAFLRHNRETVPALIDLGADVLPLFDLKILNSVIVNGNRWTLHWLNHLLPLMHGKNAEPARKRFQNTFLDGDASGCLHKSIIQANWEW